MPTVSETKTSFNAPTDDMLKHWLTELTCYTPHQIDAAIAQIEEKRLQNAR